MFKHVTVIGKSTRNQLDKLTGLGVIGGHSLVGSAVETEYSQLYHKINRGLIIFRLVVMEQKCNYVRKCGWLKYLPDYVHITTAHFTTDKLMTPPPAFRRKFPQTISSSDTKM